MKRSSGKRILALCLCLCLSLGLAVLPAGADAATYCFDAATLTAAADKEALSGGSFENGLIATFGELTKRTGSDGNVRSVEVAKNGSSGFTFTLPGSGAAVVEFSSTGGSNTSTVGLWNEAGELVPNAEGLTTVEGTAKTALHYNDLTAGTYRVVSPDASEFNRGARVYTITVTDNAGPRGERKAWADVAAPAVTAVEVKDGKVTVSYTMDTGYDGADSVSVAMLDASGKELAREEGSEGKAFFTPAASGKYTFTVEALREGETAKTATYATPTDFVLPLAAPAIQSATSAGAGKIALAWSAVAEAQGYNVYVDGSGKAVNAAPVASTEYTVEGLTVGKEYSFTVAAVRNGQVGSASKALSAVATQEAQQVWSFATFGVSTSPEKNYAEGDLNRDGQVRVVSTQGAGKILANSSDGIAFYYTAIPVDKNFTLRARIHVNSWENRSSQNAFGVAALDRVGSGAKEFWNNSYMAAGVRYAYYYDKTTDTRYAEEDTSRLGEKYNMRLGLASIARTGVTQEGLDAMGGEVTAPTGFTTSTQPLEFAAVDEGKGPGTYNLVANGEAVDGVTLDTATADYVLEVQRNNTGYFLSYYDAQGNLLKRNKTYEPKALDQLDSEYVYAGFFTARLMDATFSDVELKVNDPAEDPAPEAKPAAKLTPKVLIHSADATNSADYDLIVVANAAGTVTVRSGGQSVPGSWAVQADTRCDIPVTVRPGATELTAVFTPSAEQSFAEPTELTSLEAVTASLTVSYDTRFASRKYLYASPVGVSGNDASALRPLDLQTAVQAAQPGQTVVVKEGRYRLTSPLRIKRSVSGTEESPIYLIADPAAKTRPVLDFTGAADGILLDGSWWYIAGVDVTGAKGEGVSIAGHHNTLDRVDAYHNQATGVQISRSSRVDATIDQWPSYNTVLNCTSYGNADPGYSDADGFAAKLTAGVGNVFDGCVAYHNADDGWDLYAKAEFGPIGKVVVKNCVSYANGYLEDGTNAGDGNGFKLGGESITAYHELRDSYSFNNKNCGITCNSCPDIQLFNSVSYNNEKNNINLYTKLAKDTDFAAQGMLSLKSVELAGEETWDSFAPTGSQDQTKYLNAANYFWDGHQSKNAAGAVLAEDAFASVEFKGFTRRSDGTLDLGDFLKLTDKAPAGAGPQGKGTASKTFAPIAVTENGVTTWPDGEKLAVSAGTRAATDASGKTLAQVSVPSPIPTPDQSFADVPAGHWAKADIDDLSALGLVKGVDAAGTTFDLTAPVTRASLAQMLYRLAGEPETDYLTPFTDVETGDWYLACVRWAAQTGVVNGYQSGAFGPDDPITREQLALMLCRCAGLLGLDSGAKADALSAFADAESVSSWAAPGMVWCVDKGILQGTGAGLNPQGTASRAECVAMIGRFVGLI